MHLIILTADEIARARDEVKAMRPAGFITKPFDPTAMAAAVARMIGIGAADAPRDDRMRVARAFCASLPDTARGITEALPGFRDGSPAARETLLAHAHRLAGSAALFGHAALGRLADRIEGSLRGLARGEPVDVTVVDADCAALARACTVAAREGGAG